VGIDYHFCDLLRLTSSGASEVGYNGFRGLR
jgi:hypothetical protein